MTVSSPTNRVLSYGNGVTTVWPFIFPVLDAADLVVVVTDPTGNATTLLPVQYAATGIGSASGGSITYPLSGPPLSTGWSILIKRLVPYTQTADIQNQGGFYADVTETALDRIVFQVQQIAEFAGRNLLLPDAETGKVIPSISQRSGKYLSFDAAGNPIAASGTGNDAALRADLAAEANGAALVSHKLTTGTYGQFRVGARGRALNDKLSYDLFSLTDFCVGPLELANPFDILNLATGADETHTGNDSQLAREIRVPGNLVFPAQNRSVFVRKGQTLNFLGGREHNLSALVSNTVPTFIVGTQSNGTPDGGGLPPRITGLRAIGGPAASYVISCAVAGYFIDNIFLTAPGGGLAIGGSDGIIDTIVIDQGLLGIQLGGSNNQIGSLFFFNANYDVQVIDGCTDCAIDRIHSEYSITNSVALLAGATIKGFYIGKHKALLNQQYASHTGFLRIDAASSDTLVGVAEYRNGYGAAIQSGAGFGNTLGVGYMLADGLKTNAAYTQSSTMSAMTPFNMDTTIRSFDFRYLPGQPINWTGTAASGLRLNNGRFNACTGGALEVAINKPNGGTFRYSNVETARTLYTAGGGGATIVVA